MVNKYSYIVTGMCILIYSCNKFGYNFGHKLSYDIKNQIVSSCDSGPIYHLVINNDSITKEGFPFDQDISLNWNDSLNNPPKEINLQNIPNGYSLTRGGHKKSFKFIKLKSNSKYFIEKWGFGKTAFNIIIFTDSIGNVYRTSHPAPQSVP